MNKLLIGLLVVAAGAGAFFFLNKKKSTTDVVEINKGLIIGKWKTDAVPANDSGFSKYSYHFQKEGVLLRSISDSVKADTAHYEWNKANQLVWSGWSPSEKEKTSDSTGKPYSIVKLTQDSLLLQSADSVTVLFTKLK
jgi:hypothetical protein